jgi:hypothetical protein
MEPEEIMSSHRRTLLVAAMASALLTVAMPALAGQAATDTSGIEGRVVDQSGGILPGVSVSISSPELLGGQRETVTDANGRYRFTTLPGGRYKVTFALSGFQTTIREGMTVSAGFIAPLDATMSVGSINESVTVTGASPVVDVRTTAAVSTIKSDALEALPSARSYEDMGKLAPGVRVSGIPDVGGNSTGGGRSSLNNYGSSQGASGGTLMLEGVNTDTTAGYYDIGAVAEMIASPAGTDPEIATPGMAFQVILKSGGNDFHGDGLYAFQARRMQGNNLDDRLKSLGIQAGNAMDGFYDANASGGGRIVRDKIWFFGSVRSKEYRQEIIGFSSGAGPDNNYFTADDEAGTVTDSERNWVAKATSQLTTNHALSYFHHYNLKHVDHIGADAFHPKPSTHEQTLPNNVLKGEWKYTVNNRSFLRVGIGTSYWRSLRDPQPEATGPSTFDVVTQRWSGPGFEVARRGAEPAPTGNDSVRRQYDAAYTFFQPRLLGGEHEFKVGAYFTREWYNRFQEPRTAGRGGLNNNYLLNLADGAAFEAVLFNSPFVARNNVNNQSVYVRDSVRVGNRLTVNVGLRFERYVAFLPEQSKPAGQFSPAAEYPHTGLYDWRGLVPRVGFSYALTADSKTAVKASYGQYNWAIRAQATNLLRPFNPVDHVATYYRWNDLNNNHNLDLPGELGDFIRRDGGAAYTFNSDVQQPRTDEMTIFLERELVGGVSARAGYVYKREIDKYKEFNSARPYQAYNIPITTVDPGPDNRPGTADDGGAVTYYDFDPAYAGPEFERLTFVNVPGDADTFSNFEGSVAKRLSNGWQLNGSYLATRKNTWVAGVPVTPNEEFFPKNQTWETTMRVWGSFVAPWGILASGIYEYQSGTPLARDVLFRTGLRQLTSVTLRMEPVGARQLPAVKLLNLRAGKQFRLPGGQRVAVDFDLYNALNRNDATAQTVRSGTNFDRITAILPPRVARLGFRYSF